MVREGGGGGRERGKRNICIEIFNVHPGTWSGSLAHESFLSVLLVVEHRAMCMAVRQMSKNFPRHNYSLSPVQGFLALLEA